MDTVLLVIHLLIAIALVGSVLLQRSEGGGLGMGGGGGGGFMTGRATSDLLTKTTGILAACFMASSLTLSIMADSARPKGSILDQLQSESPLEQGTGEPSVPLAN